MHQPTRTPHTVLIIDPDGGQRASLRNLLASRFPSSEAASLEEAAVQIVRQTPAIILIETDLPGDALAFIRHLRQEPSTRGILIACVTHQTSIRDKVAAFQAGADDYVVKPVPAATFPYRLILLTRIRSY
jgi:DNA-binding response OmpR family regulator